MNLDTPKLWNFWFMMDFLLLEWSGFKKRMPIRTLDLQHWCHLLSITSGNHGKPCLPSTLWRGKSYWVTTARMDADFWKINWFIPRLRNFSSIWTTTRNHCKYYSECCCCCLLLLCDSIGNNNLDWNIYFLNQFPFPFSF